MLAYLTDVESIVRAPGRVNAIGEHTDYNDGFVMPAAIGYATRARARGRSDRLVTIASDRYEAPARFELGALPLERRGDWTDYARGVLIELERAGFARGGADVHLSADVPLGAGLSSSASFAVGLGLALLDLWEVHPKPIDVAKLASRAEAEHTGTRSGIMDQFAVLFGRPGQLLFLDTRSLEYSHLPLPPNVRLLICNTMVRHALASGEYNERRAQCEAASELLQRWYPEVRALRDVTPERLARHEHELPPLLLRRARHVVTENRRVLAAVTALKAADPTSFGTLMNASHESLRDDYAVSCAELDTMVEIARECEGVYGARMTGGGFGGCTVNLVAARSEAAFRARIVQEYREATGRMPDIYDGTPAAGAEVVRG